ncbi:nicotinate-nucleotide adenylyltransferase [Alteromonas aestuariivivens]|uniref:Probable nicotinate-nucleotide adenylyltransferase n=1 Tax=Alteromonas aestuariivivens TaxID=1938339 RepID=A0A3D8M8Z6_9ALTE|nr:nicotinate-nucleotide adenylyltransferase [Alteromonas aestuariivivens]RDV26123.1 nicotinate-nucleotide adenylyltransferase [Alteromonas aestuariivivens]
MTSPVTPVALLGGTFNPPHLGHIQPALQALQSIGLGKLGLMPCKLPPHKSTNGISEEHRVSMVKLACQADPRLYPELIELTLPEPSYSVKTLRALRDRLDSEQPVCFFMGWDSFISLPSWYEWQQLTQLCHLVILQRKSFHSQPESAVSNLLAEHGTSEPQSLMKSPAGKIYIAQTDDVPVSSSWLRNRATECLTQEWQKWLYPPVLNYIKQHGLYR